jgi:hypothetical protein
VGGAVWWCLVLKCGHIPADGEFALLTGGGTLEFSAGGEYGSALLAQCVKRNIALLLDLRGMITR